MLAEAHPPIYPAEAKKEGIQGKVVLEAVIGADGKVRDVRVVSGPDLLRQPAINAVESWHYRPYHLNGQPVAVRTAINVIFTLGK